MRRLFTYLYVFQNVGGNLNTLLISNYSTEKHNIEIDI